MKKIITPFILIALFGILTANSIYKAQAARIAEIEQKISENKNKNLILEKIKKIENQIKGYKPRLSATPEVHQLLEDVTRIVGETDIDLVSINPLSFRQEMDYVFLRVKLNVRCGYHQLGDFISKLENSRMFIKIDDIELKLLENSSQEVGKMDVLKYGGFPIAKVELVLSTIYIK
jgi:Tfp pilus assembly protein PilO